MMIQDEGSSWTKEPNLKHLPLTWCSKYNSGHCEQRGSAQTGSDEPSALEAESVPSVFCV